MSLYPAWVAACKTLKPQVQGDCGVYSFWYATVLLRQIGKAPALDWSRWTALQAMAREILNETESPTLTDLPPLDYTQTKRIEHRLTFRRH